jgi:hypothetical protein
VLKVDGSSGTIFEVTDDLSNSLMSVNTIAGLPVFEVFADYHIVAGRYNQNDFYLSTGGSLGLGTATPSYKLDVFGGGRIYQNTSAVGAGVGLTVENDGTGDAIVQYLLSATRRWVTGIDNSDSDKFKIASSSDLGSDAHLTIQTDGKVGIGTTSPSNPLTVVGAESVSIDDYIVHNGDSDTKFGFPVNNTFKIRTAGTDRLYINSDGKVGIGTATPAHQLHVSGDAQISGYLYDSTNSTGVAGYVLASQAF